ncbi:hypothetical protein NFI95_15935 [Acetobacteraceae bacterium KSS8]|uniref:Flagellar assembly protein FliH/Type III secretion system HrpE domain-containing protein n=1 Tax=Endosaccharibacter trunci TaxID=2812733 RepID=A0ABT1WDP6_9PROT|nr:hypothetical protein [Acetobacteraceae bacterium KSS8]
MPSESPQTLAPNREPERPAAEPVVLEPTFSLVELQSAAQRAREEGRLEEREETAVGLEARRIDALSAISDVLRQSRADCSRIASASAADLSRAVLAAVSAVLPGLAASNALAETKDLLDLLLPALDGEPKLQIRLNPTLLEPLRNDLATLPMAGSTSIEWIGVETMEPGDISVKWQDGMMLRDTGALCAQVVAMVSSVREQNISSGSVS